MKKLLSIFVVSCLLAMSCNNNKQAINSKDLQGRYEIDLSAVLSQLTADEDNDFAKAFAAMLLAKLDLTMQFDGDRLIIDGSDAVSGLINAFAEEGEGMPYALDYKIVNDSVLCTRENVNQELAAKILARFSTSCRVRHFSFCEGCISYNTRGLIDIRDIIKEYGIDEEEVDVVDEFELVEEDF